MMPAWLQIGLAALVGAAAAVAAIKVLWEKLIRPLINLVTLLNVLLPLLASLAETFKDSPNAFKVLEEIVSEFRTDSGSSLRDVVNRLETAAIEGRVAADILKVGVEATKLLSEQDRATLQRQIVLLDRLIVRVDAASATGLRIEQAAGIVADDLAAQKLTDEENSLK